DKVLVVYVDEEVQLQRVVSRDNSTEKEAKQRIASQIPVAEKAKQADAVIDNNGTVEQSFQQLDRSEEHTSELQSRFDLVCRPLLDRKDPRNQHSHQPRAKPRDRSAHGTR